jgi:2-polyprenylphenol 6-hydroxylase
VKSKIVVIGAGPVGLAFALGAAALRNAEVTLIERQTLTLARLSEAFDARVYALSYGSKMFLTNLGVWQKIPAARITDVNAMQVYGDDAASTSEIRFEANKPVAHIVEHAALMNALTNVLNEFLAARENIRVIAGTSVKSINTISGSPTRHQIALSNDTEIAADLVIGADGARSQIRDLAGITVKKFDYQSDGVIANFSTEKPHDGIARQWFFSDGVGGKSVVAYLPLPQQQISIVWSMDKQHANELLSHGVEQFAAAVSEAGGGVLGKLTPASEVARIALHKITAHDWISPGLALIGDAAHAIHPMAGQGANLGFADARELLNALQRRSALSAVGDLRVLRTYERARREDAAVMGAMTHGLRALYASDDQIAKRVRNLGLNVMNRMPFIKALAMDHAMK